MFRLGPDFYYQFWTGSFELVLQVVLISVSINTTPEQHVWVPFLVSFKHVLVLLVKSSHINDMLNINKIILKLSSEKTTACKHAALPSYLLTWKRTWARKPRFPRSSPVTTRCRNELSAVIARLGVNY